MYSTNVSFVNTLIIIFRRFGLKKYFYQICCRKKNSAFCTCFHISPFWGTGHFLYFRANWKKSAFLTIPLNFKKNFANFAFKTIRHFVKKSFSALCLFTTKTEPKNNLFLNCWRKTKELSKKELPNVAPASS